MLTENKKIAEEVRVHMFYLSFYSHFINDSFYSHVWRQEADYSFLTFLVSVYFKLVLLTLISEPETEKLFQSYQPTYLIVFAGCHIQLIVHI